MSKAKYIWDDIDICILQPALKQLPQKCSFAATARQIEYNYRISLAKADPPVALREGSLILHEEWEKMLREKFPDKKGSWKPMDLLEQALGLDFDNPKRVERAGCPLWNGTIHCINYRAMLSSSQIRDKGFMKSIFSRNIPILAVIEVREEYPQNADEPYLGVDREGRPFKTIRRTNGDKETHAVVLVGEYIAAANDPYDLEPGSYWIYQTSPEKGSEEVDSLLSNGLNILHPRVAIEAYYGMSYPPNVLAPEKIAKEISAQQFRMHRRKRAEHDAYLLYNEMDQLVKECENCRRKKRLKIK